MNGYPRRSLDLPLQADGGAVCRHAAPAGTQMGVVVGAEKSVGNRVGLADDAKETAHMELSFMKVK